MERFTDTMIWTLCIMLVVTGSAALMYREQLRSDSHWITQTLCDDRPVLTGEYKQCINYYAPAERLLSTAP